MLVFASRGPARAATEVGVRAAARVDGDGEHRVRWIVLLLVSRAAGILWADRGGELPERLALCAIGAASVLLLACRLRLRRRLRRFAALAGVHALVVVLSFDLGHVALSRAFERARADAERLAALDATAFRLVDARVATRRATAFGEEVELVDVESRARDERVPARLTLAIPEGSARADRLLWPGARVRIGVVLAPLRPPRNPGSPDREHAAARQGLAARARLVKPDWVVEVLPAPNEPTAQLALVLAHLRRDVGEAVRARFADLAPDPQGAPGAGLVRALALGDRRGLSDRTRRSFRQLGLAHLISVSGLHIGFVALPAAWALVRARALGRPRSRPVLGFAAPVVAGCLAAGGYAGLTGAGVPALRASLLFALFGLARVLRLSIPPATALAGIALALLWGDPARLFDAGALFSFCACGALVAGGVWGARPPRAEPSAESGGDQADGSWTRRARRDLQMLGDPLRASLAISIGMLPLVELYALPRALASPLVNALAIPFAGLVVLPCALAASGLALLLPAGGGDRVLALLLLPAVGLEEAAAWTAARLPTAWIGEDLPGRLAWPWALAIGAIAFARLRRGDWAMPAAAWILLAWLGIAAGRGLDWAETRPRVVFLDVGQADAALIQSEDAAWLIDSGPGSADGSGGTGVVRAIRALGVERLDALVITHGDLDHRGGALRILSVVNVGELWLPARASGDPALEALAAAARARGVRVRWAAAGDRVGDARSFAVSVLWPPAIDEFGPAVWVGRARNDASLVLRVELAGRRFLFTGDISAEVEERLLDAESALRAEVLKVAHHGSRQASSARFLAAVAAEVAIVSAPCGASRGLPSPPALARLVASGARLGWTGRDGAIAVSGGTEGAAALGMRYWGGERRCLPDLRRQEVHIREMP